MHAHIKVCLGMILFFFLSTGFAITVNVSSTTKNISALGFTVNGKSHGGMGRSYSASSMPTGKYSFGIRVGGAISGTDIPCNLANGNRFVTLDKNTSAAVTYDGERCVLRVR